MSGIANNESALSVRGKLNAVVAREFPTMAAIIANTTLTYSAGQPGTVAAGDTIRTREEDFSYRVVASNASDFDIQTAGGVRVIALPVSGGFYNFRSVNPAADSVTDDYPKLKRLIDRVNIGNGTNLLGPRIYFPRAGYFMGQTIEIKKVMNWFSDQSGYYSDTAATFIFPPNTHGIVVNRFNTLSTGIETTPTGAGDNSTFSGINIVSQGGTDRTKHGVWMRARAVFRDCVVFGFPGNGVHIVAGTDRTDDGFGNANLWLLERVSCTRNRNHGLYVDGIDANAGMANFCDFSLNGRMGCWDSSFLGNTYLQCHSATNGLRNKGGNASDQSSVVSHLGQRYAAHWNATEQQLVDTEPGTNANIWIPYGAGGESDNYPLWSAGKPVGTYFRAFGFFSDGLVSSNQYFNCYNEVDAPSALLGPAMQHGSLMDGLLAGATIKANTTSSVQFPAISVDNGTFLTILNDGSGFMRMQHSSDSGAPWRFQFSNGDLVMRNGNQTGRTAFYLTSTATTSPLQWTFGAEKILIGIGSNARQIAQSPTIPNNANGFSGDLVLNRNPARGGPGAGQKASDGTWQVAWTLP